MNDSSDDCIIIENSIQNIVICLDDTEEETIKDGEIEENIRLDNKSFYADFKAGFNELFDPISDDSFITFADKTITTATIYDSISDDSFINYTILPPSLPKEKRMIVIDGSDVAFNHSNNIEFSVKGLTTAIDFFKIRGHEVKAVVSQFRMKRSMTTDQRTLEILQQQRTVILTPAKNLPGYFSASNDDRFILEVAECFDAAIVSNKKYNDLVEEKPSWRKIIDEKRLSYTWYGDKFFLQQEPYGRCGPKLDDILLRDIQI